MSMTLIAIYQVMSRQDKKQIDYGVIPVYIKVVLRESGFTTYDLYRHHREYMAKQKYKS